MKLAGLGSAHPSSHGARPRRSDFHHRQESGGLGNCNERSTVLIMMDVRRNGLQSYPVDSSKEGVEATFKAQNVEGGWGE